MTICDEQLADLPFRLKSIFNPNVSLALCLIGAITPARFCMTAVAQLVGGIVAAYV